MFQRMMSAAVVWSPRAYEQTYTYAHVYLNVQGTFELPPPQNFSPGDGREGWDKPSSPIDEVTAKKRK